MRVAGEIKANMLGALQGHQSKTGLYFKVNWRNWTTNQGALIMPSRVQTTDDELKRLEASPARGIPWIGDPINLAYAEKFLDLAAARKIPIYWLLPPQHPSFVQFFERPNFSGAHEQYLRDLVSRHANLIIIDGRHAGYDRSALSDLVHLNRRGACAFSLAIGQIVRDHAGVGQPPENRWVSLPAFRDPGELPVEDSDQSLISIKSKKGSVVR